MRVRQVSARAFGALREETLQLSDGLTVVYGPNEAGKSTWHAALLAALCGRRSTERNSPLERYRPWHGGAWAVSAEICLADGRRVQMYQDLEAHLGSAKDLDIVADYSREITGSRRGEVPDATRWLGLDRDAFVATACVRQTDLRLATGHADGISVYVQRAATDARAEQTAAAALDRLAEFERAHVGGPQRRPIQDAQRAVERARAALSAVQEEQAELVRRRATAAQLRAAADALAVRLADAEAALAQAEAISSAAGAGRAQAEAEALHRRVAEVETLAAVAADGVVDPDVSVTQVAAALAALSAVPSSGLDDRAGSAAPAAVRVPRDRRQPMVLFGVAVGLVLFALPLLAIGSTVAAAALALAAAVVGGIGLVQRARNRSTVDTVEAPGTQTQQLALSQAWEQARAVAQSRVLALAADLGTATTDPARAVPVLENWLAQDRARIALREERLSRQAKLAALLGGGSVASLREQADEATRRAQTAGVSAANSRKRADALAQAVASRTGVVPRQTTVDARRESTVDSLALELDDLRREHAEAQRQAAVAEQTVTALEAANASVADAEDEVDRAGAEHGRLRELDRVLTLTRQHLERAQARANRDIAPQLAATVSRDLAAVSAGRYTTAVVDPATLRVEVAGKGAPLRSANDLSLGTAEQVYLLLRVALAERLVRPGESCPLLLDDVTVHADAHRTEPILQVLLDVAARHQVVLFTQQRQVRDWAAAHLDGQHHALRELPALATT